MSEENKALFRQFVDRVINERNADAADDFIDANYIEHNAAPGQPMVFIFSMPYLDDISSNRVKSSCKPATTSSGE